MIIATQYGKKLKALTSDGHRATATFVEGTAPTADLLIGCEGTHSVVRDYLCGPHEAALEPVPVMASATITKLPLDAVERFRAKSRRFAITFHPDGYFCWIGGEF